MASILDIAKKAGVSHGTVSNVLNKKGNVSASKIKLVEAAAMELNYFANTQAKTLRKGQSSRIALILSTYKIEEHLNLYNGLKQFAYTHGYSVDLYQAPKIKSQMNELLVSFGLNQYQSILSLGLEDELLIKGMISLDNLINFDIKSGYVIEHPELDRSKSIMKMDVEGISNILRNDELVFIYADTYRRFIELCSFYGLTIESKVSLYSERLNGKVDTMNVCNFFELGKQIAQHIIQGDSLKDLSLSIFSYPKNIPFYNKESKTIKIISNKNPSIVALEKIIPAFTKESNINIEIDILDHHGIYDVINSDRIKEYDFARIDLSIYPYFADSKFKNLPSLETYEGKQDVYNKLIEKVVGKGLLSKCVPFDTSIQTMFYRKDILDDELFKRLYLERYKVAFRIPETIEEYIQMGEFIKDQKDLDVPFANAMNINDPNVISSDFLLIYYGLKGKLVHQTGLEIEKDNGIRAISLYQQLAKVSLCNKKDWFTQAIEDYGQGRTASIFGYSNQIQNVAAYDVLETTEVAKVPGFKPMLGGGVLSIINDNSVNHQFLKWFLNPYTKYMLAQHNGLPSNGWLMNQEFVAKKFYHFNETLSHLDTAIRETYDIHGSAINIYKYEHIIGEVIKENMSETPQTILPLINQALRKEWEDEV